MTPMTRCIFQTRGQFNARFSNVSQWYVSAVQHELQ